ncbi:MAG TPA: XrtA system polysaccharide deacetylase [Steroidobacteraceae bacterium]|nr:XrtA system polysaccharide deacetylase [Steroidobacteraceae bacterium]
MLDSSDQVDPVIEWSTRPVQCETAALANALTVDVEDYFHVEAFSNSIDRTEWDGRECRIEQNVARILELFNKADVHATFFTLGWIAERYPSLIRQIVKAGHELASHGLSHYRADHQDHSDFFNDISRSKKVLEDCGGVPVKGYRAASFSIGRRNLWALNLLQEAGYRYSSSTYPIRHDLYGIPDAPRFAFYPFSDRNFIEIPISSVRRFGMNWPCGGGGYFRLLPYWISKSNLRSVAHNDRKPCVFYFHPWEIDPEQPRVGNISLKTRVRHYTNLGKTHHRLERLLKDFPWQRIDRIYPIGIG